MMTLKAFVSQKGVPFWGDVSDGIFNGPVTLDGGRSPTIAERGGTISFEPTSDKTVPGREPDTKIRLVTTDRITSFKQALRPRTAWARRHAPHTPRVGRLLSWDWVSERRNTMRMHSIIGPTTRARCPTTMLAGLDNEGVVYAKHEVTQRHELGAEFDVVLGCVLKEATRSSPEGRPIRVRFMEAREAKYVGPHGWIPYYKHS